MSEQVPSGYVWNCFTKSRDGDGPLFVAHDDTVTARLDGYAIVPREEYDALTAELVTAREHLPIGYAGSLVDAIEEFMEQANTAMDLRAAALTRIATLEAALRGVLTHDFAEECQECAIGRTNEWANAKAALADAPGEGT